MGEVAERSEDGEGKQIDLATKKGAFPSQSPSVTALPEGEPRTYNKNSARGIKMIDTANAEC